MIRENGYSKTPSSLSQVLGKFLFDKSEKKNQNLVDLKFGENNLYQIEIANNLETRKEAYHLIYSLYRKPNIDYADFDPTEMWYSIYNLNPHTVTFLVRDTITRQSVATLTVVVNSVIGLPYEQCYPLQANELKLKKHRTAEVISFGIKDIDKGKAQEILIQLFRCAYLYSRVIKKVSVLLVMISPRHSAFYEKKLLFSSIGNEVSCKKINNKIVRLYSCEFLAAENEAKKKQSGEGQPRSILNLFYAAKESSELINQIKKEICPMNKDQLEYFYHHKKDIFSKMDPMILEAVASMYDDDIGRFIRNNDLVSTNN